MQNETDLGLFGSERGLGIEFYYLNQKEFSGATAEGISVKNSLLNVTTPPPCPMQKVGIYYMEKILCAMTRILYNYTENSHAFCRR